MAYITELRKKRELMENEEFINEIAEKVIEKLEEKSESIENQIINEMSDDEKIKKVKKMYDYLKSGKKTKGTPREKQIAMVNGFIKKHNLDWAPLKK